MKPMDDDSANLLINTLRCYQDAFVCAQGVGVGKQFYEECLKSMNMHIEEIMEMAE